jgi:hypothetical protein
MANLSYATFFFKLFRLYEFQNARPIDVGTFICSHMDSSSPCQRWIFLQAQRTIKNSAAQASVDAPFASSGNLSKS